MAGRVARGHGAGRAPCVGAVRARGGRAGSGGGGARPAESPRARGRGVAGARGGGGGRARQVGVAGAGGREGVLAGRARPPRAGSRRPRGARRPRARKVGRGVFPRARAARETGGRGSWVRADRTGDYGGRQPRGPWRHRCGCKRLRGRRRLGATGTGLLPVRGQLCGLRAAHLRGARRPGRRPRSFRRQQRALRRQEGHGGADHEVRVHG
mmetsp:Transcript_13301/g.38227  ORF Transcript_13301/g.38227 Transcript_13301/m.38227 type:complete len:211 (-) Transcript_13301:203-835(-)